MVINKFGDKLYNGLVQTQTEHLNLVAAKIEAAQGETFLRELKLRWDHHNKSMQMIRDILMVLRFTIFWLQASPNPLCFMCALASLLV
jgi:cullin 3